MRKHLAQYNHLPRDAYRLSAGEFLLHLVNSAFLLIFNIYLAKQGYNDSIIGNLTGMRYLGVLLAAIPIGLFIRGRALKPLFLIAAFGLPVVSAVLLYVVPMHNLSLTLSIMFLWGLMFVMMQVCIQPYMIRHVRPEHYGEAFALHYAVVPLSQVAAGAIIALLGSLADWDEQQLLYLISGLGLVAAAFFIGLNDDRSNTHQDANKLSVLHKNYNWKRIFKALIPVIILATGAGFTFPFVNLFFYNVFGVDSVSFGLMGAGSSLLVFMMVLAGPGLKRQVGFGWAITGTQALAVVLLVALALTEVWVAYYWALPLAIVLFLLRAPSMKLGQPLVGELTMIYVGKENREIISAFTSSIWSGSWVLSSQLFALFRSYNIPYWQIFMFTAGMYAVGVVAYALLIREVQRMGHSSESKPL